MLPNLTHLDEGAGVIVTERQRPTREDLAAARRALRRVDARIRAEGEAAVIADIWDAVVDEVAELPEVREALAIAERLARSPHGAAGALGGDEDDEEALHQAVVKLVQDAQRTADGTS